MKKIITLITLSIIFFSCNRGQEPIIETRTITETQTVTVIVTNSENTETNDINVPLNPVDFFIYENEKIYTMYDGNKLLWTNTKAAYAGNFKIAISNILYYFDNNGNITNSLWLPEIPDFIAMNGTDTYILKTIDPQTAYDQGGLYKYYTDIYLNGVQVNHWSLNQFKVIDFFVSKDDTFIYQKDDFTYHDISGTKQDIFYADKNILIYDYDGGFNTATFIFNENTYTRSWALNYLGNALSFQIANSNLYSPNGYVLSSAGVMSELENALTNFNNPVSAIAQMVTKLCVRNENNEEVTYWLNCNSGNIYRHIPSIDSLEITGSLFSGVNDASIGLVIADNLNPHYIDGVLYYFYNGNTWFYDFNVSGTIGVNCKIWY